MDVIEERLEQGLNSHVVDDLVHVMQRCVEETNLIIGSRILCCLLKDGLASEPLLRKQLIEMVCLLEGLQFENFHKWSTENSLGWDVFICASHKLGHHERVIELYNAMKDISVQPSYNIFVAVLKACTVLYALDVGISAHNHAIKLGYDTGDFIVGLIIDMYGRFGWVPEARKVFDSFSGRNSFCWSSLIECYCFNGNLQEALLLLQEMQQEGFTPSSKVFVDLLRFCSKPIYLELGKQIHASLIEVGIESDPMVCHTLINMYAKCNASEDACISLYRVQMHSVVSWNSVLNGYAQHGGLEEAIGIFKAMKQGDFLPDEVTYISLLKACCSLEHLEQGKQLHASALIFGFDLSLRVGNSLLNMYIRFGRCEDAKAVFYALPAKDVVTWNIMIKGCLEHEDIEDAFSALKEMQEDGICPDHITYLHLLQVCSILLAVEEGRHIHSLIIKVGFDAESFLNNTLIDMYGKAGSLEDALLVFDTMPKTGIVSWNALMTGYALHNQGEETLRLYLLLEQNGKEPNKVTYLSVIKACASLSALGWGKSIHEAIKRSSLVTDLSVSNALVDMYAKCGSLKDARELFDTLLTRNVITWSTLMTGYAEQSDYDSTLRLFNEMQQEGIDPDGLTFLSLLSACSHKGLVNEGLLHLREMRDKHGIFEMLEHFDCIADLLGCQGLFDAAEDVLETMCFKNNIVGWLSLMNSCRLHANVGVARRCFDYINALARDHAAAYVMLSSVYVKAGMHREAEELELVRISKEAWKKVGQTYIEVDNRLHLFMADDKSHPQTLGIHSKLESLSWQVKEQGLLDSSPSLVAGIPVAKQELFCRHSEKLAITFGLLNTPPNAPIRVSKNIRICANCHEAIKLISKIERREIIVRDVDCIHNFKHGICSCEDRDYVNSRCDNNVETNQ